MSTYLKDADYAQVGCLFEELATLPGSDARCAHLRTQIIELCLPLARHIALRYRGRGQAHEDLVQAASVGLVSAMNRFDLAKGKDFLAFAIPTMMGEVRKHFRDRGWDVRVPRSLQENYLALNKARTALTQDLGREPTVPELAKKLGVEPAEVAEIVAAGDSYHVASLDAATIDDGRSIADTLGEFDSALDGVDNHETLRPALLALPERERTIVLYRFFGELTQAEIAEKVGLSQMHVSRLLAQTLAKLRTSPAFAPLHVAVAA